MNIDLSNHKALVCGASQGIGAAIASSLASCGCEITLLARNENKLKAVLSQLKGDDHHYFIADLSRDQEVIDLCKHLENEPVDIVINNTGGPAPGAIEEAETSEFQNAIQMHLMASHQIMQAVLPHMKTNQFGRFINVVSTSVKIPIPGLGVSNTIRGSMASWSKTLSHELAPYGITVNNILPGLVETDRLASLQQNLSKSQHKSIEEIQSNLLSTIPMGRFGKPEELGDLAVFLASSYASYITGVSIPVDGGKTGSL